MKTLATFLKESATKTVKKPQTFYTVFGQHAVPYHDRAVKEDASGSVLPTNATHDSEEHHKSLSSHYKFDEHEGKHIYRYTADSTPLNRSLIHKHENPTDAWHHADHEREHGEHQKHLDSILSKHKTPETMHVFSGTSFNPERMKPKDHDGKSHFKIHLPAYSSTSTSQMNAGFYSSKDHDSHKAGQAHGEHNHMLHITVPKGSKGAYVAHHSRHDEKEFLMARGSNLKVHPHPTIINHHGSTTALWHAHLEHD